MNKALSLLLRVVVVWLALLALVLGTLAITVKGTHLDALDKQATVTGVALALALACVALAKFVGFSSWQDVNSTGRCVVAILAAATLSGDSGMRPYRSSLGSPNASATFPNATVTAQASAKCNPQSRKEANQIDLVEQAANPGGYGVVEKDGVFEFTITPRDNNHGTAVTRIARQPMGGKYRFRAFACIASPVLGNGGKPQGQFIVYVWCSDSTKPYIVEKILPADGRPVELSGTLEGCPPGALLTLSARLNNSDKTFRAVMYGASLFGDD